MEEFINTIKQLYLIGVFRTLYPVRAEYLLFSREHGTFIKIGHILDHKTNFKKFKRIEIIQNMFSSYKEWTY